MYLFQEMINVIFFERIIFSHTKVLGYRVLKRLDENTCTLYKRFSIFCCSVLCRRIFACIFYLFNFQMTGRQW